MKLQLLLVLVQERDQTNIMVNPRPTLSFRFGLMVDTVIR